MKKIVLIVTIIAVLFVGCSFKEKNPPVSNVDTNKTVNLYFSDGNLKLLNEKREIQLAQGESVEKRVVEELIKGPKIQGAKSTVPLQTKVNSVSVRNGIAVVDLSEEFITKHQGGSEAENLTIYSVVNTLTDLININKVQFLINGQVRQVFNHMELQGDFERDESLLEDEPQQL